MQKLKLTLKQFAEIKTMIKSRCCNCYQGNCLLLDDGDTAHNTEPHYLQIFSWLCAAE